MSTLDELITKFGWEFLTNQNKKPFLKAKKGKRVEYIPITSDAVKNLVLKELYAERGAPPARAERDQIHDVMTAKALFSEKTKDIRIRTASSEAGLELDLNNEAGECVSITREGWKVGAPTAAFYRPSSLRQMATPKAGATWDIFKKHFKTKSDEDLMLIIGFMLSCFRPQGPYPILVLQGEQGSAKSTTANMIKKIVDPSLGQTRGLIKKEQDLFIAAQNNHLLSFDNVSGIQNDLSDALCRIATCGSFSARTLYSNEDETLIELSRPVLLNGITDFVNRADLASRSIIIELPTIPPSQRKTIEEVEASFHTDLPEMMGVLMDGLTSALKNCGQVRLKEKPRMADMVVWCTAAEEGLGWHRGAFLDAFNDNQLNAVLNNLSTDPVANGFCIVLGLEGLENLLPSHVLGKG